MTSSRSLKIKITPNPGWDISGTLAERRGNYVKLDRAFSKQEAASLCLERRDILEKNTDEVTGRS